MAADSARRRLLPAALLLASCATPYQALRLALPAPLPDDAFERACATVRAAHGELAVADEAGFRLQSRWQPYLIGELTARRRATVFRLADGALAVVVERQLLEATLLGEPEWLSVRGDPEAERALAEALAAALQ